MTYIYKGRRQAWLSNCNIIHEPEDYGSFD